MGTIENVVADTVLIFFADLGNVIPYAVDVIEELVAAIAFVFLPTQFAQSWHFEEGYHVYSWLQNNL